MEQFHSFVNNSVPSRDTHQASIHGQMRKSIPVLQKFVSTITSKFTNLQKQDHRRLFTQHHQHNHSGTAGSLVFRGNSLMILKSGNHSLFLCWSSEKCPKSNGHD
jgi:hypothetical protein